jgi:L-threonylcarbamoyladenylate synthase
MTRLVSTETDVSAFDEALRILANGGLVVFPTDTVYGVGAAVDRPDAVARLFLAKGRPLERAIPVLVSGEDAIERLSSAIHDHTRLLVREFWPGPLTIVLPAAKWLPVEIVRDTGCVGVRMPDHPVALTLIERSGGAIATTSANQSGEPETDCAADALDQLDGRVDLVVDGGRAPGGVPSTVVKIDDDGSWRILRHGAVSSDMIEQALQSRSLDS